MSRLLALLLLAPLTALAAEELVRITPEQQTRSNIRVSTLAELRAPAAVTLPAQVVVPPTQIEILAAPLPALVISVGAAYGDVVKKGQVLARLQGAAFSEVQREFVQAQSQARLAAESRRRDESLFADGIIAQSRLSVTLAQESQAAALMADKRQSLRLAGIGETAIGAVSSVGLRAPFDGVVLESAAQPGQRVDGMTMLFKLGKLAPLWLEIQASAAQAANLTPGDTLLVPGCDKPGKITLISPQMQMASQSLLVRAELTKPAGCVKPFQFVQVQVTPSRALPAGALRVPPTALARHSGQTWVFVETSGGFRPVAVKVLDESAESASVSAELPAELAATARVAISGVATLKATWLGLGAGEGK